MPLSNPIFRKISRIAGEQGVRAFVVGGYVRDHYLRRPSTDIDVVVVGSGIALAEALGRELHTKVSVFKTFGTAMLRAGGIEVEFCLLYTSCQSRKLLNLHSPLVRTTRSGFG